MDPGARFAELMSGPSEQIPLDEAMLLIAAHAHPELDIAAELERLDALADGSYPPTLPGLLRHLFDDLGFRGNRDDYYDPRNSFLNEVVTRRVGIPLTLSVLTIVVGRRVGVPLAGVSMPGHFLLRDRVDPSVFVDPFLGGALVDAAGCERAFRALHGEDAAFDPSFLEPVDSRAILRRALANLRGIYAARGERSDLTWVLRLQSTGPAPAAAELRQLGEVLAAGGRFDEAAAAYARAADAPGGSDDDRAASIRIRARLN